MSISRRMGKESSAKAIQCLGFALPVDIGFALTADSRPNHVPGAKSCPDKLTAVELLTPLDAAHPKRPERDYSSADSSQREIAKKNKINMQATRPVEIE